MISWDLCLITLVGVLINFGGQAQQLVLQLIIAVLCNGHRLGMLPASVTEKVFAAQVAL